MKLIVTAMENPLDVNLLKNTGITNLHIETENYKAPKIDEMDRFIQESEKEIENGNVVGVHCGGGKGRAGTFLTCFIMKNGIDGTINHDVYYPCKMDA